GKRSLFGGRSSDDEDEEREAADNAARSRSLFENTALAYHEVNREGLIRRVNSRECAVRGVAQNVLIGRPCWELVPPDERAQFKAELHRKLSGEMALAPFRRKYKRPDGAWLTLEVYETLIRDRTGVIDGLLTASLDITERQKNEEDAFRATTELKALFQAFPDLFLRVDSSDFVRDVRAPQQQDAFPLAQSFLGRRFGEAPPADAVDPARQALAKARKTGQMVVLEYGAKASRGEEVFEARLLPLRLNEIIIIVRNITERKQAERQ